MAYGTALAALADNTRRQVFEELRGGPQTVGNLAARMPVSRPAVSQHLKVLRDVGLVTDRQVGTRRLYQLDPDGVAPLRAYFERFWNQALAAFKDAVEHGNEEDR